MYVLFSVFLTKLILWINSLTCHHLCTMQRTHYHGLCELSFLSSFFFFFWDKIAFLVTSILNKNKYCDLCNGIIYICLHLHSLLLLQFHHSVRHHPLAKLPRGIRKQHELCVAHYSRARQSDPSHFQRFWDGAPVWLSHCERRWDAGAHHIWNVLWEGCTLANRQ